jgi:uncharacterized protein (TIGR02679 family)
MTACRLCDGECRDANLGPLLAENLLWLWQQAAAAADRRGDPVLTHGTITVKAPASPEQRAAVLGLIPGRPLMAGQARSISLTDLSAAVRRHGPALTPGAVAAHAAGRQLAARARRRQDRRQFEQHLAALGHAWAASSHSPLAARWDSTLTALRAAGWIARLQAADDADRLLQQAFAVIDALPETGARLDRRLLATKVTRNPHALDDGQPLTALVLAMLAADGVTSFTQRPRQAWAAVGVNCDDLTGGLIAIGIHPDGWHLPADAAVTLPPRELTRCRWPPGLAAGAWTFVTENPSVASAAADLAATGIALRLLCMSGTPSALEVAAIARLSEAGWRVAVRADFDDAGIAHVAAVLRAAPSACPWRMHTSDYYESLRDGATVPLPQVPDTPWEPGLASAMRARKLATFEEALMSDLLSDLRHGEPSSRLIP